MNEVTPNSRSGGAESVKQNRRRGKSARGAGASWTVQATQAKNRFGDILKRARNLGPVFIEKHGKTQAVVLDIDSYNTLVRKGREPHELHLDALREEFDALYASMQGAKSQEAVTRFLSAPAKALNQVAAKRAKNSG